MDSSFRIKFRILVPLVLGFSIMYIIWLNFSKDKVNNNNEVAIQGLKDINTKKDSKIANLEGKLRDQTVNIKKAAEKESQLTKKESKLSRKEAALVEQEAGLVRKEAALIKRESRLMKKDDNVKSETNAIEKAKEMKVISFNGNKIIHLDLKGGAPKMAYLLKLLPTFIRWGASGFLIEYEDMFPYDEELSVLKSHYAYKLSEVTAFLDKIKEHNLLVVPLVQTFGHMEFVLKHEKFAKLRHIANMTNALNAANDDSIPLVKSIVKQIIKVHKPYMKYLHIGGDEVWTLKNEKNPNDAYIKHMSPIIDYVVSEHFIPIIWDDMMRDWTVEELKKISSKAVEPMVWGYPDDLTQYFPEGMWERYSEAFENIWIASAFKGADTPSTDFVPITARIQNHQSWLNILSKLKKYKMNVSGIALTGWSRFDHDAILCELLPASLPSLALCLAVLKEGELSKDTLSRVSKDLGFHDPIIMNYFLINGNLTHPDEGKFSGHTIFGIVLRLRKAQNALESVDKRILGWFNDRQSAKKSLNVYQFDTCIKRLNVAINRLDELKHLVKKMFLVFYTDDIMDEWIWDKITSTRRKAVETKRRLNKLKESKKNAS